MAKTPPLLERELLTTRLYGMFMYIYVHKSFGKHYDHLLCMTVVYSIIVLGSGLLLDRTKAAHLVWFLLYYQ